LKKILLILLFSYLIFSYSNNLIAAARYDGPKTVEQAKEKFFKNRKLDIIEGIWYDEKENSYRAVVKVRDGVYNQWTITSRNPNKAGTLDIEENIIKSASDKLYIYHSTIYNIENLSEEKEGNGTLLLEGNLLTYFYSINPVCFGPGRCTKVIEGKGIRIWPSNVYEYNINIQKIIGK
jgi:hypothetical protein